MPPADLPTPDDRGWAVLDDPASGAFRLRLSGHVETATATEAMGRLAERLMDRVIPTVVIVDLFDVTTFDFDAPIAVLRVGAPVRRFVKHVEIIAARQPVRIAAVSVANLLDVRYSVRAER